MVRFKSGPQLGHRSRPSEPTPHLGYVTYETLKAFYTDTLEAVVAFSDGKPIRIANPDALAHAKQRG